MILFSSIPSTRPRGNRFSETVMNSLTGPFVCLGLLWSTKEVTWTISKGPSGQEEGQPLSTEHLLRVTRVPVCQLTGLEGGDRPGETALDGVRRGTTPCSTRGRHTKGVCEEGRGGGGEGAGREGWRQPRLGLGSGPSGVEFGLGSGLSF